MSEEDTGPWPEEDEPVKIPVEHAFTCKQCGRCTPAGEKVEGQFICRICIRDKGTATMNEDDPADRILCSVCEKHIHSSCYSQKHGAYFCVDCAVDFESSNKPKSDDKIPNRVTGQCSQCGRMNCSPIHSVDEDRFRICDWCFKKRNDGSGGLKYDAEKLRSDLLSVSAMKGTAKILTLGAKKYAERNWEAGMLFARVYRAAFDHLTDWFDGEDLDRDSGESHLDHCACCLMFLQHFVKNPEKYKKFDNRPNTKFNIPAIRLRRENNDEEKDFFIDSDGKLDHDAIKEWQNGSDAFIVGIHQTQKAAAEQQLFKAEDFK